MAVLVAFNLVLLTGLGLVLFQRFRSTRNPGYLVLMIPLVFWTVVRSPMHWLVRHQIDRYAAGESMAWPLSVLTGRPVGEIIAISLYGTTVLHAGLLIFGFLLLGRNDSPHAVTAAPLEPVSGDLRSPDVG
jgi:hypothetical protein